MRAADLPRGYLTPEQIAALPPERRYLPLEGMLRMITRFYPNPTITYSSDGTATVVLPPWTPQYELHTKDSGQT